MRLPLFEQPVQPYTPEVSFLNPSVPEEARPRLSKQCQKVLERLQQGRASNRDLSAIAMQYNARIYELRHAGYVVECVDEDKKTGMAFFELREK